MTTPVGGAVELKPAVGPAVGSARRGFMARVSAPSASPPSGGVPRSGRAGALERSSASRQYKDKWPRKQRLRGRQVATPGQVVPKHVQNCSGNGARAWWVYTWKRAEPLNVQRAPYQCRSWRCPSCRRYEASVTFARIQQAWKPLEVSGTVFCVLTIDRNGFHGGRKWASPREAYAELARMSRCLLKRWRRACEARGWKSFGVKWVAVVEAHRTGWPHVNLMLHCPELALELEADRTAALTRGASQRASMLLSGDWLHHATASGWGKESTAEKARDQGAIASYMTKLAGDAGRTTAELAKLTQVPMNAPVRFRRLRAGKGFLPPRHKNPDVTGTLVRRVPNLFGTMGALPVHKVAQKWHEQSTACCVREEDIMIDEARLRRVVRDVRRADPKLARLFELPPVTTWRVRCSPSTGPPIELPSDRQLRQN